MDKSNEKWAHLTVHAIEKELHTDASCGLSCKEARLRYRSEGANTLFDPKKEPLTPVFKRLLRDPAWVLLLFVCLVAICFRAFALVLSNLICGMIGVLFTFFSY